MTLTTPFSLAVVLSTVLAAGLGHADDDKAACAAAYGSAQTLRDKGDLLGSRQQLLLCAKPSCAAFMVKECTQWLEELKIPTVVLAASSSSGEAMVDVTVLHGDKVLASTLDGKSVAMNPGSYDLVFRAADGREVKVKAVVLQGQKDQLVKVTFPAPGATAAPKPAPVSQAPEPARDEAGSPLRTIGIVTGIGGLVVAGIGAGVFGSGKSKYSDASAACTPESCPPSAQDDAATGNSRQKLGVGLLVGGGLLAVGGVVLFLVAPTQKAVGVAIRPTGVWVVGRF